MHGHPEPALVVEAELHRLGQLRKLLLVGEQLDLEARAGTVHVAMNSRARGCAGLRATRSICARPKRVSGVNSSPVLLSSGAAATFLPWAMSQT